MPPYLSIAIINSNDASRKALETTLNQFGESVKLIGSVADFVEGTRLIQTSNPMVVILEVRDAITSAEEIRHILSKSPRTSVFVTSADKSSDLILSTMRAG